MERLLWICVGGAAGTAARYGIGLWASGRFTGPFPIGTIVVNLVGCFAVALVMSIATAHAWPATLRMAITIGFIGGFTTYSSFNYETTRLVLDGASTTAVIYLLVTTLGALLAGWLGLLCGRQIAGS
jgi:CrcB protein